MLSVAPGVSAYIEGTRRIVLTPDTIDQLAHGVLQLVRRNGRVPLKLTRAQRAEFDAAKQRGFVITHNRDRALRKLYGVYCDVIGRPFITVDPRIVYAGVACEIDGNRRLSDNAQQRIEALWQRYGAYGAYWSVSEVYVYCSKIRREYAERAAAELWQICQDGAK